MKILTFFTVRKTIFQIKRSICQYFSTVDTGEALWMEVCAHCLQTVLTKIVTLADNLTKIEMIHIDQFRTLVVNI